MKKEFDYIDFIGIENDSVYINKIVNETRKICPDALICIRQTSGTDFPPFMTIESPEYHEKANAENIFTLIQVLPF